jgi:hypothetical protein
VAAELELLERGGPRMVLCAGWELLAGRWKRQAQALLLVARFSLMIARSRR